MAYPLSQIEKLSGDNYTTWAIQMKSLLITLDFWSVVKTRITKEATADDRAAWQAADQKALATIILSVKSSELIHVKNCSTAKDAWEVLKNLYQAKGPARKVNLFKKLVRFQFDSRQKFSPQVNSFCAIIEDLKEIDVVVQEDLQSILFLCSLPEDMENFVVAIETQDTLLKLDKLMSKILEEEQRRNVKDDNGSEQVFSIKGDNTNNTKSNVKSMSYRKKNIKCYGCGKRGHIKSQCRTANSNNNNSSAVLMSAQSEFTSNEKTTNWILDSGASSHMCHDRSAFCNFVELKHSVMLATGDNVTALGMGNVLLKSTYADVELSNVLYIPNLHTNILSVSKIIDHNCCVKFVNRKAAITTTDNKFIFEANLRSGVFIANLQCKKEMVMTVDERKNCLWHSRFGHLNFKDLNALKKKGLVNGIETKIEKSCCCEVCAVCKISKKPFKEYKQVRTQQLLEVVHTDIFGPVRIPSAAGSLYFISFIDDFSRYVTVYFMNKKSEALKCFKEYKSLVENHTGYKIKAMRSDNGKEYINNEFCQYLKINGIQHQTTVAYTPQLNGIAERANRTLVEMSRCMLEENNVPHYLWAEAINTAVHIRNRCPTKKLTKTPYEIWNGKVPNVNYFRVFGCEAVLLDKKPGKSKFEPKGKKCIFVGYSEQAKAYRMYCKDERCIQIARDVLFFEDITEKEAHETTTNDLFCFDPTGCVHNDMNQNNEHLREESEEGEDERQNQSDLSGEGPINEKEGCETEDRPRILRSGKTYALNSVQDAVCNPSTVEEALKSRESKEWRAAMQAEYDTLQKNSTWKLIEKPQGKNVIGCKWVFTCKRRADGTVEKYKARLVAQGCSQRHHIDYFETYSPVIRHSTIRLILAVSAQMNLIVNHIDIVSAYLNGTLQEEVFMFQPPLFEDQKHPEKICKLEKALYGLKQAGREWNLKIDSVLHEMGFKRCSADNCVYFKKNEVDFIILGLYVDDIILACSSESKIKYIVDTLNNYVEVINKGPISYFLGMQIERNSDGNFEIHQTKYIEDILIRWNMNECKSSATPSITGSDLEICKNANCPKLFDGKKYQSLIGALNYLAVISRPDISYIVSKLSQFNAHNHEDHFKSAKHVLRYLKRTINSKICYTRSNDNILCYTDADWGSDVTDRKSYSGYVVFLASGPIAWESQKQHCVSLSSMEAEYVALGQGVKEICFIRSILTEIQLAVYVEKPTIIKCDNQGAKFMAENPSSKKRSKHIDIRYHFIREKCKNNEIKLMYVESENNVADIMTKSLSKDKHFRCFKMLNLINENLNGKS